MSLRHTPVIADSDTAATLEAADALATFIEDEKRRTQERMRKCEAFVNSRALQSKSIKEGLSSLLQNAEDDYSTYLHLERVLNMRDGGDHNPVTEAVPTGSLTAALPHSVPAGGTPSGDGRSSLHRIAVHEHSNAQGFSMGGGDSVQSQDNPGDDLFDPLRDEDFEARRSLSRDPPSSSSPLSSEPKDPVENGHDKDGQQRAQHPAEELDEFDDDNYVSAYRARRAAGLPRDHNIARSLPVTVPMPQIGGRGMFARSRRGTVDFDLDTDDEKSDGKNSDIASKMAEIAKSMYDGGMFGELPSPRVQQKV